MRILLVCAGGFTTSLMAENVAGILPEGDSIDALPIDQVADVIDDYDVVLLGPQVKYRSKEIQKICDEHGKRSGMLEARFVATLDGKAIYNAAKKVMEG